MILSEEGGESVHDLPMQKAIFHPDFRFATYPQPGIEVTDFWTLLSRSFSAIPVW